MNSLIVLSLVFLYFASLFGISCIIGKKSESNTAFFIGNRQSPWYVVSIGMIGSSLSGVTFVSVPGMVRQFDMTYLQMVFGFFIGYTIIAIILIPLFYKLNIISIYSYLKERIGYYSYKTGASFFIISKLVGAAARLYLVIFILQKNVFDQWDIPFVLTTILSIILIWLYTFRGGVKTIIWTDALQTVCLIGMLILIIWKVYEKLDLDNFVAFEKLVENPHFRVFEFKNWSSTQHFVKQFLSGIFITLVMTGLDQDMMQKNLSCKNIRQAQKNMFTYGFSFIPINFLFLSLGVFLIILAEQEHIQLPILNDQIVPLFCTSGILSYSVLIFFTLGIIAAAFSSADSALTALTTSFYIDILEVNNDNISKTQNMRKIIHLIFSILFILIILAFGYFNNRSILDAIYTIASYSYGPLLGLFSFGLLTRRKVIPSKEKLVPFICILSPIISYLLNISFSVFFNYQFGYELLLLNGFITFIGIWFISNKTNILANNSNS